MPQTWMRCGAQRGKETPISDAYKATRAHQWQSRIWTWKALELITWVLNIRGMLGLSLQKLNTGQLLRVTQGGGRA